jgi:hypothetical protein
MEKDATLLQGRLGGQLLVVFSDFALFFQLPKIDPFCLFQRLIFLRMAFTANVICLLRTEQPLMGSIV